MSLVDTPTEVDTCLKSNYTTIFDIFLFQKKKKRICQRQGEREQEIYETGRIMKELTQQHSEMEIQERVNATTFGKGDTGKS
jgi:hypothetical protein